MVAKLFAAIITCFRVPVPTIVLALAAVMDGNQPNLKMARLWASLAILSSCAAIVILREYAYNALVVGSVVMFNATVCFSFFLLGSYLDPWSSLFVMTCGGLTMISTVHKMERWCHRFGIRFLGILPLERGELPALMEREGITIDLITDLLLYLQQYKMEILAQPLFCLKTFIIAPQRLRK